MEAQTDVQTYIERGKQALAQGQGREAAIAFAHAAQIEPNNPYIHLGLAEANLALGSYGVVYMACRKVQELQSEGGTASTMAQALLDLLDRRYDRALQNIETVINDDPANAYAHAMRSYLLRLTGQDYDAGLARSRASRLSYGGTFENVFPPVDPARTPGYKGQGSTPPVVDADDPNAATFTRDRNGTQNGAQIEGDQVPGWTRQRPGGMSEMQRRRVRARFWMSQNPRFVTNILIGINVLVFLISVLLTITQTGTLGGLGDVDQNILINMGAQWNLLVSQGQWWRIFTAMFLHLNLLHIGLNMLSLFFIGTAIEMFYGKWRYLTIYMLSGIVGGIVSYFVEGPGFLAVGASGAIFGVFGALGVFYFVNRRALGRYGSGAITNWVFWLALNLVFGFSNPQIGIVDHLGGLVAGMVIALLLIPRLRKPRVV
ncbi:MAG TPA: rhomboid family intramembrane serine protease [Ktedonobacteraceae bacterium]|nr:rhomboid family intramembrane serine protease [Ktedonobacteraceae bacterium]